MDEVARVQASYSGKLGCIGLEVFEAEPVDPNVLCATSNVVHLPHAGSGTK